MKKKKDVNSLRVIRKTDGDFISIAAEKKTAQWLCKKPIVKARESYLEDVFDERAYS